MTIETPPLFGKTRFLEGQIDEFLDKISEGAMYFEIGLNSYMDNNSVTETVEEKLRQVIEVKDRCKELRRSIITTLYTEMLIPDARGDVLSLLSDLYYLLDVMGNCFQEFMIEQPLSNTEIKDTEINNRQDFKELIATAVKSIETVVTAARTFFRDPMAVRDYIYKVRVYEDESDKIALRLKKNIFSSDLSLDLKIQLRDGVDTIDNLSDEAENVADELSIYAIKRAY